MSCIDAMAERAAAAQRMMNSMTAEQRAELMSLAEQAFGSPDLMQQLAQLDANLQALRPGEDWRGSEQFDGEQGLGLGDGTGVLQDLAGLDQLAEQVAQSYDGARLDDIDLDLLSRAARQPGRRRRPDPATARAGAAGLGLPQAQQRRPAQAQPEGDAAAGQGPAQGRRPADERVARASATCARRARPASCPARPASGSSATPSRGTSRARSPTPYDAPSPRAAGPRRASGSRSATSR